MKTTVTIEVSLIVATLTSTLWRLIRALFLKKERPPETRPCNDWQVTLLIGLLMVAGYGFALFNYANGVMEMQWWTLTFFLAIGLPVIIIFGHVGNHLAARDGEYETRELAIKWDNRLFRPFTTTVFIVLIAWWPNQQDFDSKQWTTWAIVAYLIDMITTRVEIYSYRKFKFNITGEPTEQEIIEEYS